MYCSKMIFLTYYYISDILDTFKLFRNGNFLIGIKDLNKKKNIFIFYNIYTFISVNKYFNIREMNEGQFTCWLSPILT